jgi:hypothetical protein
VIAMDSERLRLLQAMGVDVYVARSRDVIANERAPQAAAAAEAAMDSVATRVHLVAVCARGVRDQPRLAALLGQLPRTLGISAASIHWLEADAQGALASPLEAPAYLVFGAPMARALGVQLSTMQQNSSVIAVTAEPAQLPGTALDKRALWQVLKPLAQRLRAPAH